MINVDKAVLARLKVKDKLFEVLVDCDKALEFRKGKCSIEDAIASEQIFKNHRLSEKASEHDIKNAFGTNECLKVVAEIIKKGEVQLTTEHKKKLIEEKRKSIINIIHRNAINPQNNLPNPPQRIEAAIEQAKVRIDEFKSAEDQIQDIIKSINAILPIRLETRVIEVVIPAQYAVKSFHSLKSFGKILNEQWKNDGSLLATLDIPAGMQEDLENELNKISHGNVDIRIVSKR
ncbi:ribosome assembly factor SBDS [Candidatus Woesearchaeota archaeon]|nr:ribosome assembly factor SBDS [Candidatus Woesearchaeota archaeon]